MAAAGLWCRTICGIPDFTSGKLGGFCRSLPLQRWQRLCYSGQAKEITETAEYPPVKPRYPPGRWGSVKEKVAWKEHEECSALDSIVDVKEKLERQAGEKSRILWDLAPLNSQPGTLAFKQYITKTHIIDGLPEQYSQQPKIKNFEKIKAQVRNAILLQECYSEGNLSNGKDSDQEGKCVKRHNIIRDILHHIVPYVIVERPHLQFVQFDEDVRLESFIRRRGFTVEDETSSKRQENHQGLFYFQTKCTASFQIRAEKPLVPLVALEDDRSIGDYPREVFAPSVMGFRQHLARPITVSGHWVGDPCEWCLLGVHVMGPDYDRFIEEHSAELALAEMVAYGLVTAFTSVAAQAHNQGFSTHQDLTYPIVAQAVVTDGLFFRFFCYQLNTLHLWKPDDANPLRNLLWVSPLLRLYETVKDSQLHGLNEAAVSNLLHFMLNEPQDPNYELRPNLQDSPNPRDKKFFINFVGEEPFPQPVIGRWQYPRNAVYF